MALNNMQVYQEEIQTNTIELLDQMINEFNGASGNAIILQSASLKGDYEKAAFWNTLATAQRRVDRYATNNAVASTALSQGEIVGVKVAGGFGPIIFEPSQLEWLKRAPADAIMAISEGFANALLADQLNTSVGAAVAAIENQAALVNDVSALTAGAGALTQAVLNGAHAKFGDMSQMLVTDVMTGQAYHRLIQEGLTNGARLFSSNNVTVVNILGKNIVVSDIPSLYAAGTPNKTKVLSLTQGGIIVNDNGDLITNLETQNGKERIETTWQADYSFNIKLKGYAWDTTNGGKSPTDAELFTGSNWDKAVSYNKHTAGVLSVADADQ